ncbi:MAG: TRAP transporter small permease [Spirochaetales bacterium]|jgi:TRAP-type C4-dicarboxylate transport system permease small subunit|nr:TRAP transporter small permease [Spirochaetales bacterium]
MNSLTKIGKTLYRIYLGIGIFSVAVVAGCVIYAVIARYFFGVSHTFLEEFITTAFAFTTFWGMGICFIQHEHVAIESIFNLFPPVLKKILALFNYAVVFTVLGVMLFYGFDYVRRYGHQISFGMRIPMAYMYGIIPVGCLLALVCVGVNFARFVASLFSGAGKTP